MLGVTDYAQQQLGDVVFVELPAVGRTVERGEPFGVVESVKAVADLFGPVSGRVVEVNAAARRPARAGERRTATATAGCSCSSPTTRPSSSDCSIAAAYRQHVKDRAE